MLAKAGKQVPLPNTVQFRNVKLCLQSYFFVGQPFDIAIRESVAR